MGRRHTLHILKYDTTTRTHAALPPHLAAHPAPHTPHPSNALPVYLLRLLLSLHNAPSTNAAALHTALRHLPHAAGALRRKNAHSPPPPLLLPSAIAFRFILWDRPQTQVPCTLCYLFLGSYCCPYGQLRLWTHYNVPPVHLYPTLPQVPHPAPPLPPHAPLPSIPFCALLPCFTATHTRTPHSSWTDVPPPQIYYPHT